MIEEMLHTYLTFMGWFTVVLGGYFSLGIIFIIICLIFPNVWTWFENKVLSGGPNAIN